MAFLIFHHDDDDRALRFIDEHGALFADIYTRGVTDGDDFVDAPADCTITSSIRERYLRDATVAIVLLGRSTWSRRFVDWEIASALGTGSDDALALIAVDLVDGALRPPRLPADVMGASPTAASLVDQVKWAHVGRALRAETTPAPLLRSDLRR